MLADYTAYALDSYNQYDTILREALNGKFCILGRVDTGTTDIGVNPFWSEYVNVGTHAVVLDTILSRSFITLLSSWWSILFAVLLIPLFFFATNGLVPGARTVLGFAATIVFIAVTIILFAFTGKFLPPLGPALAMIAAVIIREVVSYAGSEREKQFIRKAFSTYVSGDVVRELIADPSRLQLGGSKRHMSAIFTDIRSFSTISERLDPEDLVSLLNRYLTSMSDVVLLEKGTIDKYEGDAIIAFFGAPLPLPDHAYRACVSAITMKRIEKELNKTIIENKLSPFPLLTRIGINTGSMVAGNMGTENKMNYTIMGNAVNLAARLEGVNKQYGTWILASDNTVNETGGRILTRRLDKVRVVGINNPVQLYELIETMENATAEDRDKVGLFHEALGLFETRQWKNARQGFEAILAAGDDPVSAVYLERCDKYLKAPPGDTWDGVVNLNEK
ncbi:MAG: hypothetical protein LBT68_00780 [Spirochaetales bacterium]|nr:hypothetical protein [Spirochaetales bacterium]